MDIKDTVANQAETDTIVPIILGLVVALAGIPLVEFLASILLDDTDLTALVIRDLLLKWLLAGFVIGIVVFVEKRSFSSIGVEKISWKDVVGAVLVFLVGAVSYPFTTPLIESLGLETTVGGLEMLATLPLGFVMALALTAAVTEELLYRSYPIERISELTGSPALAAGITFVFFVLFHIPF